MKLLTICFATLCLLLNVDASYGQEYQPVKGKAVAFAKVVEDPKLPRVLIIGDSISIGYTPALRELMHGEANIYRIPTNGGPTTRGLESIDAWLGDTEWDVIHFNWGLHDLKFVDNDNQRIAPDKGTYQVPLNEYEDNLRTLVKRLKQTDAQLIWRNTTPVPAGCPWRLKGDEKSYNEVAAKIMKEFDIPIDDHHSYVMKHMAKVQREANVHFTSAGSRKLAELAAESIRKHLD